MLLTAGRPRSRLLLHGFIVPESDPSPCLQEGPGFPTSPRISQSSWLSGTVTVAEAKVLLPHASVTR